MSTITVYNGTVTLGFTGNSCADFARAYSAFRWKLNNNFDTWYVQTCSIQLLPTSGSFTFTLRNTASSETSVLTANVVQMDSYFVREPMPHVDPLENFTDGAALGWAVALAMCAAWAIMVMKRGI